MKSIIAIIICLKIACSAAIAGEKRMTTDEWLVLRHTQIESYTDISKIPRSKLKGSDERNKDGYLSYSPAKNGLIRFKDGSWIILTSHSIHKEDGIGDITLIKTSDGKYYSNRGHCCSSLMIRSKSGIKTLKDFLLSKCIGNNAHILLPWTEYNK